MLQHRQHFALQARQIARIGTFVVVQSCSGTETTRLSWRCRRASHRRRCMAVSPRSSLRRQRLLEGVGLALSVRQRPFARKESPSKLLARRSEQSGRRPRRAESEVGSRSCRSRCRTLPPCTWIARDLLVVSALLAVNQKICQRSFMKATAAKLTGGPFGADSAST